MRVLVVGLDGASFVFTNTFVWQMPCAQKLFGMGRRRMLYIDDIPNTPVVWNDMFTGRYSWEHGVRGFGRKGFVGKSKFPYVWDVLEKKGYRVKVVNVPVKLPPVWKNASRLSLHWIDAWTPPRENFERMVYKLHDVVKVNIRGDWNLFIVWYPVPDQAHHHFFPTIPDEKTLRTACNWYNLAFCLVLDLIALANPDAWMVVSDHGFTSDFEEFVVEGVKQHVHVRDGLVVSNRSPLPEKPIEVYNWILRQFGVEP